jgi:hypothetical protein
MKVSASVSGGGMISPARAFAAFRALADEALLEAVENVATEIEAKGHADISQAGNFGGRWTDAFKATVSGDGGEVKLDVTMTVPYWTVFQFGKVIKGRPLLYFKPTKAVGGLKGMEGALPAVISKHEVTIPKKFHLIEIAQAEAARVPLLFKQKLGAAKEAAEGTPHG